MMSLGAAMAKKEIEEATDEMASLKATGKSKKVAGYNCNEYEFIYDKEKSLSYVTTELDFNWPKAFGKMMDKFMPKKNSLPAEAFQGMALEATSYNKKGKEITVEEFHRDIEPVQLPDFEEENEQDENYQEVIKALSQIGEQCKEIILLTHYQGVPRDEIAEQMGYTKAFARIKLFRCMNKLRKILGIND